MPFKKPNTTTPGSLTIKPTGNLKWSEVICNGERVAMLLLSGGYWQAKMEDGGLTQVAYKRDRVLWQIEEALKGEMVLPKSVAGSLIVTHL